MKKNLINALKKLLVAFGGNGKEVTNNAVDIVDKIADQVGEGNNATGSGGSGGLYVTITEIDQNTLKIDKTYNEIIEAINSNKNVSGKDVSEDGFGFYSLSYISHGENVYEVALYGINAQNVISFYSISPDALMTSQYPISEE